MKIVSIVKTILKIKFDLWLRKHFSCEKIGHEWVEQNYALKIKTNKDGCCRYKIIHDRYCARCGVVQTFYISNPISRAEMLRNGWGIEDEEDEIKVEEI